MAYIMPEYHTFVKDAVQYIKKGEYQAALYMYGLAYRHAYEHTSYGHFDKRCTAIANCVRYVRSLQKEKSRMTTETRDELLSLRIEIDQRIAVLRTTMQQKGANKKWFDAQIYALQDVIEMLARRVVSR